MKTAKKHKRQRFQRYLRIAGYSFDARTLFRNILFLSAICTFATYTTLAISGSGGGIAYLALLAVPTIFLGFPLFVVSLTLLFYVYTDLRIQNRKRTIEQVLPEFLHLAAANIRAGMSIDQALWSAVRPRFGVLTKEMEMVAKENMVGKPLSQALREFSEKYESKVLRRTISLLIEGIEAGSEVGDLLENIALSIQDIQMRKESMAANVTSYVIFIMFSVLVAAPLLFAVSIQLLRVVHQLGAGPLAGAGGVMGVNLTLSSNAVQERDFFIFCILSLLMTTAMANIIIAAIKTGNASDAIKNIPAYSLVSLGIFLVAQWVLGYVFASII